MKKLLYSAVAFATLLFAASCQQESLEPVAGDGSVTYTVQMPGSIATKAVGDDLEGQYKLIYEVYRASQIDELDKEPLYEGTADFSGKVATVQLQFVKRQDYKVLFWAQSDTLELFNTTDLREVSMNSSWKGNDLATAVFAGTDEVSDCVSAKKGNVTLVRPVSQINIATSNESLSVGGTNSGQTTKTITMSTVTVAVKGLHTTYNVWDKEVEGVQDVSFTEAEISTLPTEFNSDYKYVAMNYVGFAPVNGTTVDVDFSIVTSEGEIDHQVANVPIKANYRTNILGNLITEENEYTVTIDTSWSGTDIVCATDGEAVQAVLDNAVAGSTIYLQPGVNYGTLYMRPVAGGAQTKVVDWIGNNYRFETYSLFENITIVGAEGATVDAIEIEGGTYYNTEHSQAETYPVMLSLVELKNVVFDGVTFTGKGGYDPQGYGNAVNLSGNNIKVDGLTFKNCVLNNTENNARLLYKTESTTHVHNYSYDGETYTFSPSLKDITITGCTLNGGYMGLELREAENVTITNNTFNVADRNILLPVNTGCTYSGNITITGNVSNNAKERFVRADGTGDAVVVISDNILNNYQGADADPIKVTNGNNVTIENNIKAVGANDVDELKNALADGAEAVSLSAGTYTFPASSLQPGQTIICEEGTVFTGTSSLNINGATVDGATFKNEGATAITGTLYGTLKNCTFEGYETLRWCYTGAGKSVVFENCVIKTTLRGVHFDEMNGDVTFRNCEINGFNAYSGAGTMTFEGCTFGYDASNYNGLNIYTNTVLKDCTFNYVSGKTNFIDMEGTGKTLTIENCTATLDGAAAQIEDFIGGSQLANNTVIIN